jgi:D-beta-D-heptose 7-phosphate kinase/D-beta-D-heptose 1-phosphate adenosyltransferase
MLSALLGPIRRAPKPRVLVVGDLILDRYHYGSSDRPCPEAAVPLLRAGRGESRLGGAANVARILAGLGADVVLGGVVGADRAGRRLRRAVRAAGLEDGAVLDDPTRPTTVKSRYIRSTTGAPPQLLLRVDREDCTPIPAHLEGRIGQALGARLPQCDLIVVSDYGKGVCTGDLLRRLILEARRRDRRLIVDPASVADPSKYRGAGCLTPNRDEARAATGMPVDSPEQALVAGEILRNRLDAEAVVVTLDREGMVLAHRDGRRRAFPALPRRVCDPTGAGDMVVGVLGFCLAAAVDYEPAIRLGNLAGGLVVERIGVCSLGWADLLAEAERAGTMVAAV